jgi:uroporphyrinogen-III synthase
MKRVVITRPGVQASDFGRGLHAAGFEAVYLPAIEIVPPADPGPLDAALRSFDQYDWIVLTSANGVAAVWERMERLGIPGLPADLKVAAIGPVTAQALLERGIDPDFMPHEYVAEAILPGLGELVGLRVLLPRAAGARKALPEAIRRGGGSAHEVTAYETAPALPPEPAAIEALRRGVEWITFTSPSTVQCFTELVQNAGLDPLHLPGSPQVACIGPITAAAAQGLGYYVAVVAGEYTTAGLIGAILQFELFARKSP